MHFLWEELDAVCCRLSRQESWTPFASTSVRGRPIPRQPGEGGPLYSRVRLPRYPVLPCEWLFASDERRRAQTNSEKSWVNPWMEVKRLYPVFVTGTKAFVM